MSREPALVCEELGFLFVLSQTSRGIFLFPTPAGRRLVLTHGLSSRSVSLLFSKIVMIGLIKKLFGSRNDREVKKLWPRVKQSDQVR